jgi:hypothetical protein
MPRPQCLFTDLFHHTYPLKQLHPCHERSAKENDKGLPRAKARNGLFDEIELNLVNHLAAVRAFGSVGYQGTIGLPGLWPKLRNLGSRQIGGTFDSRVGSSISVSNYYDARQATSRSSSLFVFLPPRVRYRFSSQDQVNRNSWRVRVIHRSGGVY